MSFGWANVNLSIISSKSIKTIQLQYRYIERNFTDTWEEKHLYPIEII